jgi:Bacterial Ig domain
LENLWLSGYYGGIIMQKNMIKAIGTFTLVLFVMSMTGAAACTLTKANSDTFNFNPSKHCGNVLSNDKGTSLKIVSMSKCASGGKVTMKSNGAFCYKPASCSKTGTVKDSFTYKMKSKCGKTSTAKVTINYKCH